MTSQSVTVEEAGARLEELIDLVERGGEVVILKGNQPTAKLVSLPSPPSKGGKREFGQYRGKIRIPADFDEPLPDEFWLGSNT